MNFKIITSNNELKQKALHVFTILGMKESIHIQDVNFWLVDVKTMDKKAIESYKNRKSSAYLLFVINDDEDIKILLENDFTSYINISFSKDELKNWYNYFTKNTKNKTINLCNNVKLNLERNEIHLKKEIFLLTKQEVQLLKSLISGDFISTKLLKSILNLNSETSVRTLVNRIRKKIRIDIFIQKRNYGYKLNILENTNKSNPSESYIKELEEQNELIQKIVDNSSIYIATFIHKQLFCINKSFRDLLGNNIVKELWNETNGDFFQLIEHNSKEKEKLKEELFNIKTTSKIRIYNFKSNDYFNFKVQTYFFEKLDKHLLIFS